MIGTLLCDFGSCERHSKFTNDRDVHPLDTNTKVSHSSSSTFLQTGQLTEIGILNYLTKEGNSAEYTSSGKSYTRQSTSSTRPDVVPKCTESFALLSLYFTSQLQMTRDVMVSVCAFLACHLG